jgi:hypothetical protein
MTIAGRETKDSFEVFDPFNLSKKFYEDIKTSGQACIISHFF